MLFSKKLLLASGIALAMTGCVNNPSKEQQLQISGLQSDLITVQKTQMQAQIELAECKAQVHELNDVLSKSVPASELAATQESLATSKANVAKLNRLLAESTKKQTAIKNASTKFENKTILGQAEWVYVSAVKTNLKARVDSGAATASISAENIERFERDGKKWVRFALETEKGSEPQTIEAKIVRFVNIIQASNSDEKDSRLVVRLHVRIGDVVGETEFTLVDRTHMEYPVLIGRTFLQDIAVVDVSKEYIYPKYVEPTPAKK